MKVLSLEEFHEELKSQAISSPDHSAVKCPVCGTVQSKALLRDQGCPDDKIEGQIGFSCVGRWNNAGPHKKDASSDKPGCDWTLGGLFNVHTLEVEKDGVRHPMFEVATPEEAQQLEESLKD
tara:strand:- start:61 stop:426 length:366 start_codon:yes stop_codon:yes gene_type:complete